ncbi:hypothetical protein AA13595_0040 [Gluconacetobacter johannae DSM 13595]|uniref:Uncharacterized protein n=1 Tax=Gluconacetobacter johannae TaxID=112140 RepID=A0A7W4P406_9PROT|nr:hypothetical protein [Gluconacetobacter johannae]MBB2176756.1 hypothetical protein [Gluconacetobacter johannae]GBQ79496.1 hypothetical protein AA13595_0040 [Gluconacetobacter johannae DSM 13595]
MTANRAREIDPIQIENIATRLRRLIPDRRDPEQFHTEKSELEHLLRQMAKRLRKSNDAHAKS